MTDCPQRRPNHAEIVLPDGSPVLVYQISSTDTRVLVDVKGPMPRDVRGYLNHTILPQMPGEWVGDIGGYFILSFIYYNSLQYEQYNL